VNAAVRARFNADAGANYDWWYQPFVPGVGYAVASSLATTGMRIATLPANNAVANDGGSGVWEISDYARTTFNKTAFSVGTDYHAATAAAQFGMYYHHHWRSTAAITQIDIIDETGGNFVVGSRFDLYGVA
jgi:hypothetical protein